MKACLLGIALMIAHIPHAQTNTKPNRNFIDFSVDVSGTSFKLPKHISGSIVYTTDGMIPTDKALIIIGKSIRPIQSTDRKQFCIDRLKQLPRGASSVIRDTRNVTFDNMHGYEITADGKNNEGEPQVVFQVLLFTESGEYYIITGMSSEDFEKSLEMFRKVTSTFKRTLDPSNP